MLLRWQILFDQLDIIDTEYQFFSRTDLLKFETKVGFIFPYGYKEFCQVFASGIFGSFVNIRCPNLMFSNEEIKNLRLSFEQLKQLSSLPSSKDIECLLDNAFVFGRNSRKEILCGI